MGNNIPQFRNDWGTKYKYSESLYATGKPSVNGNGTWIRWSAILGGKHKKWWQWCIHSNGWIGVFSRIFASEMASNPFQLITFVLVQLQKFFSREVYFVEMLSGIATLGWGLIGLSIQNSDKFELLSLQLFLAVIDSNFWSYVAVILGLGQLLIFRMIDFHWKTAWLRWIASIIIGWLWTIITVGTASHQLTPITAAPFTICIANMILTVRIFWNRGRLK